MKFKTLSLGLLWIATLLTFDSSAQNEQENIELKSFSLGVRAEAFNLSDLSLNDGVANKSILATYNLNQRLRLDAELGFGFQNSKDTEYKSMGLKAGIGVFGMTQKNKLNFYYGLRVAYTHNYRNTEDYMTGEWEKKTQKIFTLSPTIGAEYFLTNQFSLGSEFSVNANFINNEIWEAGKSNLINTSTSVILRYYF